jgi:hypothetical protein
MLDYVEAGFFQGIDPGSAGLDMCEPQLFQFLERFAHGAAVDFKALGEVAL